MTLSEPFRDDAARAQRPLPVLYSFRRCPYAMRARSALAISGTPIALREVKLSAKPADMLAASPKATVPVLLVPGGFVIDQSEAIMRWALARHDPEDWLARDDVALIAANDGQFKRHLDRYKYAGRFDTDPLEHRVGGLDFLAELEARLQRHPYLCGGARGLTDAAIVPFVRQFAGVDPEWFHAQQLPGVRRWLSDYVGSPLFAAIMLRTAPWQPQDAPLVVDWGGAGS
ncbi:MAG: glutathione S-transferase [Sphingobium sp.]